MRIQIWRNVRIKQWYFRIRAVNGRILCHSEGYNNKTGCLNAVGTIHGRSRPGTMIVEEMPSPQATQGVPRQVTRRVARQATGVRAA